MEGRRSISGGDAGTGRRCPADWNSGAASPDHSGVLLPEEGMAGRIMQGCSCIGVLCYNGIGVPDHSVSARSFRKRGGQQLYLFSVLILLTLWIWKKI